MFNLVTLEKQEQTKPKASRWNEVIKIRAETNKQRKTIEAIKPKVSSLKRSAKLMKLRLTGKKGEDSNN